LNFMTTFLSYVVKSPEYYDIPRDEVGEVVGSLAFYSELAILPWHLLLGGIMDTVGRKIPTVLGLLLSGVSIIGIPFGKNIYPDLCIMRILIAVGVLSALNSPLLPDYVKPQSLGLANSYV